MNVLCGRSASGNLSTTWWCINNSSSPHASFFTEQRSETLVGWSSRKEGISRWSNTIKIENVGIFYPFPVVAVGWLLCKRSPTYRVSVLGYAYALHFPAPDRPSRNFNPLRSFTSRHAEHNCPDMAGSYTSFRKSIMPWFISASFLIFIAILLEYENIFARDYNGNVKIHFISI